jgi:hypothetical protein
MCYFFPEYLEHLILLYFVLATGPDNPPAVRVRTAKMVPFSSRTIQKPDPLGFGGANPDLYLSTCRF